MSLLSTVILKKTKHFRTAFLAIEPVKESKVRPRISKVLDHTQFTVTKNNKEFLLYIQMLVSTSISLNFLIKFKLIRDNLND